MHTFLHNLCIALSQVSLDIIRANYLLDSNYLNAENSILLFTLHEGERYKDDKENKSEKLYLVNSLPFYYFFFPFPNHAKGSQRILEIPLFNDRAGLKLEGCSLSFRHLISARFVIFQYIYTADRGRQ